MLIGQIEQEILEDKLFLYCKLQTDLQTDKPIDLQRNDEKIVQRHYLGKLIRVLTLASNSLVENPFVK